MPNSQGYNVSQSSWALDAVENFETSPIYTADTAKSGSSGELQNDYTFVHSGERFANTYALSCSNFGITWPNESFHPLAPTMDEADYPQLLSGSGVQIGYETAASTASLPAAGTYKTTNDWNSQFSSGDFSLSAWILPVQAQNAGVKPFGWPLIAHKRPYVNAWPVFYFGSTRTTNLDPGGIYLALDKRGNPPDFMESVYHLTAEVIYDDGAGTITTHDSVYTTDSWTAASSASAGSFLHLAMTYTTASNSAEGRLKLYLNGILAPGLTYSNPGPIGGAEVLSEIGNACFIGHAKKAGPAPGFLGGIYDTGSYFYIFNGLIDEPSVWKKTLSNTEVFELYNLGKARELEDLSFSSDLVSWWRNGDSPGDIAGGENAGIIQDLGPFSSDAANITDMTSPTCGLNKAAILHTASMSHSGSKMFFTTASVLPGGLNSTLHASPTYNRKQTLKSAYSVVDRHGIEIPERDAAISILNLRWQALSGCSSPYLNEAPLGSIEPFGGTALWEADRLAGHSSPFISSPRSPFYDSYNDYAVDTKFVFKGGTILSSFRISDQIDKYTQNEDFLIKTCDNFSIFGLPTNNESIPQNSSEANFNTFYTNSEFMQFFDVVKTDHDEMAIPSEITIKCKALKKFIPYDGFYPSERTLQIVSQFSKSYSSFIEADGTDLDSPGARSRPVMAAMFSPGILYNSIKAGIAVDYPVATDTVSKFEYRSYVSGATELTSSGYWALGTGSNGTNGWDYRVPFEALLEPEEYLQDKNIVDMEPDPSCSLDLSAKLGQAGDNLYKLMINNFLAEIPEFFLRNDEFTAIRSLPDNSKDFGKVDPGKTYGMRVKIRRSMNTSRKWYHPIFPPTTQNGLEIISGYEIPQDPLFQPDLRETFTMYSRPTAFGPPVAATSQLFNPVTGSLQSLCARLSYAGNKVAGPGGSFVFASTCSLGRSNQDLYPSDSLNGYNPSFTPPYYNGEAWADILYTAPDNVTGNVSLDQILNNSKIIYWRIDGRPILRTRYQGTPASEYLPTARSDLGAEIGYDGIYLPAVFAPTSSTTLSGTCAWSGLSSFDPGVEGTGWHFWANPSTWNGSGPMPMSPLHANKFAMQLSASINLLGREDVLVQDFSADGKKSQKSTVGISGRWVIQPKFETPMFNFGDQSIRPIRAEDNTLTIPTHGSESVPRGMWHQYGCIPRSNEGVYLEVADIPENWVNFRGAYKGPELLLTPWGPDTAASSEGHFESEHYDDYGAGSGVHSLMDIAGFTQFQPPTGKSHGPSGTSQKKISKKLGQLKEGKEVSEAIVAIPFYLENGNQKLFSLEKEKIQAILDHQAGTALIHPDAEVGKSLFDLVSKMQKFVLPPRYDFVNYSEVLNNPEIGAFAMYIFEFTHTFTSGDLSHIWQNVMPDAGLKSVFNEPSTDSSITHPLVKGELLDAEDFEKDVRWVVFKIKQRASKDYFEKTTANKNQLSRTPPGTPNAPSYNWPYDFFSLIELGNMETQVTLRRGGTSKEKSAEKFEADTDFKYPEFNYNENK